MKWLSDNIVAKLQSGLGSMVESDGDPETEVDLHLKGQLFGGRFAIERWLGSGGMGTVYRGVDTLTGEPAVVKLIHPSFVGRDGKGAALTVLKEATALGALGKIEPHPPHVVRLLGTGTVVADVLMGEALELPWLALEFVDGGAEGSTLEERLGHALRTTGHGFTRERAARAVGCLARGLDAVHGAHVVHRDVKPANVLCSGSADSEIFKLADFGVSRPLGVAGTFGGLVVGTPGYAPPELMAIAEPDIGPWTDVFSFAALVYFFLAGDHFFPITNIRDCLHAVRKSDRKKLIDGPRLCPELRANPAACQAIDEALLLATLGQTRTRTATAGEFGDAIVAALRGRAPGLEPIASTPSPSRRATLTPSRTRYSFQKKKPDAPSRSTFSAAWDGPDRCLVATPEGVFSWDGARFGARPIEGSSELPPVRFAEHIGEGRWLVGGEGATFAVCTLEGVSDVVRGSNPSVTFELFGGEVGDLGVLLGTREGGLPALYALVGRHWLKPLPLRDAPELSSVARVDMTRWLLAGKDKSGHGFAALYAPLAWEMTRVAGAGRSPLSACAGDPSLGLGLAVAADGTALVLGQLPRDREPARAERALLGADVELTAAHVEPDGRLWVGGAGRLFTRAHDESIFTCVYKSDDPTPFVALASGDDRVVGLLRDLSIVEGARARD